MFSSLELDWFNPSSLRRAGLETHGVQCTIDALLLQV
jgi:hypothetical protein